jgi:hypothetical protein
MNTQSSTIIQRVWNYCNVLRGDGNSHGDYVERWLSVAQEVESVARAGWLMESVQSVLKFAFEGRL